MTKSKCCNLLKKNLTRVYVSNFINEKVNGLC